MKRRSYRRRRDESDSESSSSYSQQSSKKPEDLYGELKSALVHNDKYAYRLIRNISRLYKHDVGIIRLTLGGSFSFCQKDIEQFFCKFGKIENVIIKQTNNRLIMDDFKNKEQESIAYVIYADYFSAVLALKVINSTSEKQKILKVQICTKLPQSSQDKHQSEPLLYTHKVEEMIVAVQQDHEFGPIANQYKYVGTIGLDLTDRNFHIRERILGVEGCNFVRIYYLCDKSFKFENEGEEVRQDDLKLKLVVNKNTDSDREVLVMSHSLQKYNNAIRYLHELMEQIVQEYKNSRQKSMQIIAKDIHIRRWQKFSFEPQLKFIT